MKLLLNIDDTVYHHMNEYTEKHNLTIENLLSNLFIKYVQEPAVAINLLYTNTGSTDDLKGFIQTFTDYINKTISDLETDITNTSKHDGDITDISKENIVMIQVFKRLIQEPKQNPHLLLELFKVYWDEHQKL